MTSRAQQKNLKKKKQKSKKVSIKQKMFTLRESSVAQGDSTKTRRKSVQHIRLTDGEYLIMKETL